MRIKCTITKQQDILWCENKAHADAVVNSPVLWSDMASIMGDKNMHGLGLGVSEQLYLTVDSGYLCNLQGF